MNRLKGFQNAAEGGRIRQKASKDSVEGNKLRQQSFFSNGLALSHYYHGGWKDGNAIVPFKSFTWI